MNNDHRADRLLVHGTPNEGAWWWQLVMIPRWVSVSYPLAKSDA